MSEKYDARRILEEIKLDEKVMRAKPVLLSQKEIGDMRKRLSAVSKERAPSK